VSLPERLSPLALPLVIPALMDACFPRSISLRGPWADSRQTRMRLKAQRHSQQVVFPEMKIAFGSIMLTMSFPSTISPI
jgi:hypothetical protein